MELIRTEEAVGHVLCHDMTQIIPGVKKDAAFRKGHVVTKEDIPVLLSMGKENLYVWEKTEGMLHEDEAAMILCGMCTNEHMTSSEIKEGKISLLAEENGLLKVDTERLNLVNALGELMIATRHGNFPVKKGDLLASTRIIPLVIEEEKMSLARQTAGEKPLLTLLPFHHKKVFIITTGSEVRNGLVEDGFGPAIRKKLEEYEVEIIGQEFSGDDQNEITNAILKAVQEGADLVLCTGGMSVDPDDATPGAIKNSGARVVEYGAPVLPGAMFLLAYYNDTIPVLGLPGCVMYAKRTIFDLILPRILADDRITSEDISSMGEGGLCLSCEMCTFPNCGFGKS